jgi:hypothetical protein
MNAQLNRALANTKRFDSGALGSLAMVLHPFTQPGHYHGEFLRDGQTVGEFRFVVAAGSKEFQLDIDCATEYRRDVEGDKSCACDGTSTKERTVSPKGYVLFHASQGSGYAVRVTDTSQKVVFDSTKLEAGDYFALTLMEPAHYVATNTVSEARMDIVVEMPKTFARDHMQQSPESLEVSRGGFAKDKATLPAARGTVFEIKAASRIVVARRDATNHDAPLDGNDKPIARWRRQTSNDGTALRRE